MKRFLGLLLVVVVGTTSYSQGDLRLGVNAGLPLGEAADVSSFNIGADVAYLTGFGETFQVGPMVGYNTFVGEGGMDNLQFLPIAATARLGLMALELGTDVGYALAINEGMDGGFYYRPKVGFSFFGIGLIASYTGIRFDEGEFSSVNFGIEFRL